MDTCIYSLNAFLMMHMPNAHAYSDEYNELGIINMSTYCRNSGTSLQAAVSGMLGTLLISAKLFLCLFIWLGLQPATSRMLPRALGGDDAA